AISMSPRSSEECTSSSDSAATYSPVSTRRSSPSSASFIPASSSSVSSPAWWRTFAWALDPAMSYFASRQSKSVDLLSLARASAGPSENRPPHRLSRSLTDRPFPPTPRRRSVRGSLSLSQEIRGPTRAEAVIPPRGDRSVPRRPHLADRSPLGQTAGGEFEEGLGQGLAPNGRFGDDEDSVVTGDGAEDTEGRGSVDRRGQVLGGPGRGAQHDGVVLCRGGDEQLLEQSRQLRVEAVAGRLLQGPVAALTGDGVDGSGGRADLHGPHLGEVARQGRLGDGDALGGQRLGEFDLAAHGLA